VARSARLRLETHLQSLIEYFSAHAGLALAAVFGAALLESLAVIGTILPGSTIVFAGGMLIGLKALDPWLVSIAAVAGAILGDGVSYWLGHRYHGAIRSMWPLRDHPALLARGEAYFAANGGRSVFLGRFFGPLRAIVPVVAGMANMPAAHFYAMNALSALVWAGAHLLPGALFGASLQLAGAVSSRLLVLIALVVAGLWLIAYVIRLVIRLGWPYIRVLQDRIVRYAHARSGWVARLVLPLVDPARRESVSLLVAATVLIGGAWLFLGVVEDVVTSDTLVVTDRSIYDWLQATRTGWVDDVMVTITALGSAFVTIAVIVAVALWLAMGRRWRTLAYWIAAVGFAELLVWVLKLGFERARPETRYAAVDPYSFPSGHAALSIVVYGFLAFLLAHGKPGWQKIAVALPAAGIALLIAFSRLYLGAHWFSDVAASAGLGLAWIGLLCIAYIHHVREKPLRAVPMLIVVLTTLTFFGTAYAHRYHDRDVARYAKVAPPRTLTLDGWRNGEWRSLPVARSEWRGQREEPFSLQWVAAPERIAQLLEAAHWRPPPPWQSGAALLWLLPATPIDALPVLPKFHQGQPPALTFVLPQDARDRFVVRLWRAAVIGDDAAPTRLLPLWNGIVTVERARTEFGMIATARTTTDFASPLHAVEEAVRGEHATLQARMQAGTPVLLVW
jgi:undecaprenyl-diphosphatase